MNKHYHFIGIGGIGMSALASLLLDQGFQVSGSDLRSTKITNDLRTKGASVYFEHAPENIKGADCIIYSSAINQENPEFRAAKESQVRVLQRAQLLAELMQGHIGITVAGAHGKTTTTSMIANLLTKANFHPTTAIGGVISGGQSHGRMGNGDYFVTEVDESDGTFLYFAPFFSVITNIDLEHIDYYPDWESILKAYKSFIGKTDEIGKVIANGDDGRLVRLLKNSDISYKTYGFLPHNNCRAENVRYDYFTSKFNCVIKGRDFGQVTLNVTGRHNVANALACISLGMSLALDFQVIRDSLKEYQPVQRRFQLKSQIDNIWVIDDYAHHPTEIKAVLDTAQEFKQSLPGKGNLITIVQPHRYSRLKGLLDEFAHSLTNTDELIITDVYAANEVPIRGASSRILCNKIRKLTDKPVRYLSKDKIVKQLLTTVKPNDVILTLGAGDITYVSDEIATGLIEQTSAVAAV